MSKSRRRFLQTLPTAIAAGAAATSPASISARQAVPASDAVTTDALGMAQQLIGIDLPSVERESARPLVSRNRENYELIRKVAVPSETEPALAFRPPRPSATERGPSRTSPAARPTDTRRRQRLRPSIIDDLAFEPVTTLASLLASRQVSSTELTAMYLARLKRHDPTLHCVVTLTEDLALAQAAEADREIRAGRYRGPLHGIPYGIKDLFAAKGVLTTWGAKPYADQVFDYDATAVARLREAGAVLVAKLSTGELAVGDLWFRARTRNPWNPERGSSGSSAGPASATVGRARRLRRRHRDRRLDRVAGQRVRRRRPAADVWAHQPLRLHDAALDARQGRPAHAIGGRRGAGARGAARPRRPRRNRAGSAVSLERRARRQGTCASDTSSGSSTAPPRASDRPSSRSAPLLIRGSNGASIARPARRSFRHATRAAGGGDLRHAQRRSRRDVRRARANAARINELADKGPNGRANQLRASRFIPAVEYIRAQRVRTLLMQQMNALFETVDVFLAPSQSDSVTMTNLTGHPAVVLPGGFVDEMPVALMLTGKLWDEATLLRAAARSRPQQTGTSGIRDLGRRRASKQVRSVWPPSACQPYLPTSPPAYLPDSTCTTDRMLRWPATISADRSLLRYTFDSALSLALRSYLMTSN